MGKPMMLQDGDFRRIEALKKRLGTATKVEVVRAGLGLLEREADRVARVARWRRAAKRVAAESRRVNAEFRAHARLRPV